MTDTLVIWRTFETKGFFAEMRRKLKEREYKQAQYPTIESIPIEELIRHLIDEWREFDEALENKDLENIKEECCDMANLCAMVFVNLQDATEEKREAEAQ